MNICRWFRKLGRFSSAALAVSTLLSVAGASAHAQTLTSPVGVASTTQTVTVTLPNGGLINSIAVVTQGSTQLDFTAASSNSGSSACNTTTVYTAGQTCTVQYVFKPTRPFTRFGSAVVYDLAGDVLGNAFLTGVGNGPQVSYPLGAASASTALGSGFSGPAGIAVDSSGNVFVADTQNNAIKEIPAGNGAVATIGAGFSMPAAVAIDGAGNLYVADAGNHAVKKIVATNGAGATAYSPVIVTLAATNFTFSNPQGIAVDASGNVYVADEGLGKVEEIAAVNGAIPATPTVTPLGSGFSKPVSVALDGSGNLYVADTGNNNLVEINGMANTSTILASGLSAPQGVVVDGLGDVFFGGTGASVNELVVSNGTLGTTPIPVGSGFSSPLGVAVDAAGDLYVADTGNNSVKELVQTAPSVTFTASTVVGSTSTDSPQSFTLQNSGNAGLTVASSVITGTNPVSPASFSLASASTCPVVASGGSAGTLAKGTSCVYSVNFLPVTAGTPGGTLTLTDNALNATSPAATQTVALSGTSTAETPQVSVAPASATVNGTNATLTATVTFGGVPPTGAFSFTVSPSTTSYTATCSVSSSSQEICTYNFDPSALQAGSYTIQGTIAADPNYTTNSNSSILTVNAGTPTVTVTSSGSPSTVDSTVTLTATIAPNTGIKPGGSVGFTTTLNGTTSAISGCSNLAVNNGQAMCVTAALQAGANSIVATIAKDNNFTSASSTPVTQQVNTASTTLTIASSQPTSSTVDQPVTFTATLSGAQAFTVSPTGTVKFTSNGTVIPNCSAVPLSSSQTASCIAYALIAPADVISAVFTSGDSNFSGSTAQPSFTQTVQQATPVNTIQSNLQPSSVNQKVTFTATITPPNTPVNGVAPGGSVTFTNGPGGAQLCSPAVVSPAGNDTATASCSVPFGSVSTGINVFAVYSGDSNFTAGNSPSVSQTVSQTSTSIPASSIVTNPGTPTVNQNNVTLTATLTPAYTGSTPPGGYVTFYDILGSSTTTACVSTLSSGTVPPCTYIFRSAGVHTLQAVYSGDTNFSTTTSSNTVTVVTSGTVTLNLTTSASPVTVNQTATYSAVFAPPPGPIYPSGTVQYFDGSTAIPGCNVTVSPTGTIPNCTETLTTANTHTISAVFTSSNTSSFSNVTSGNLPEVVSQNTSTTKLTAPSAASSVDQVITFSANVAPTQVPATPGSASTAPITTPPTGSITFSYTLNGVNTILCSQTVTTANGVTSASCPAALTAATTYSIVAAYSGDGNFSSSTSTASAQLVNKTGTALGLAGMSISSPSSPAVNQSAPYTVQISLAGGISDTGLAVPGGSVVLKDASNGITCTAPISTSGQASCTLAEPTSGPHTIVATYPGDNNFGNSASSFPVTITASATSITASSISSNPSSPMVNQTVMLTAALTPSYTGTAQPSGTVSFTDTQGSNAAVPACTASINNGTVNPCSYVFTTSGTHTITATYSGDSNFSGISQTASIIVGGAGSLGITLASTTGPVTVNQQATYSAAFSPVQNGPTYPSGTVQFFDGGTAISGCNFPVSSSGAIPSCTETVLTAGTHVITAAFTSNNTSVFSSTTSGNLPQVVNQGQSQTTVTVSPTPSSVNQTVTFSSLVSPVAPSSGPAVGTTLPGGTVTYYGPNNTALCTATLNTVSGVTSASCTAPFTAAGSYAVTASYSGDANYKSSNSASYSEVVNKTATSVSLVAGMTLTNPASPAANQSAAYTVQITPAISATGLTLPTGNVVFTDSTNPGAGCTAVLAPSTGQASCSFATVGSGTHNITANYTGDNNFSPNTQSFTVSIAAATPMLTITAPTTNPTINLPGFAFNSTLAVPAGSSGQPTGYVTYSNAAGVALCKAPISAGVVSPCAYTFGSAGIQTITATYPGDTSFSNASATLAITVSPATPVINLVSAAPTSVAGQQVTFTATVTPSPAAVNPATGTPAGTITFAFAPGSVSSGCAPTPQFLNGTETASCTVTYLLQSSGTYSVTATYGSDSNYNTTQKTIAQNVQNFSQTLTPGSVVMGQGDSNTTDPYSTAPSINYTLTAQNGFSNATMTSCPSTVTGLTCTVPATFSIGSSVPVVISTTSAVAPGTYTLQVLSKDPTSSLSQSTPLSVTVLGRVYPPGSTIPYSVPTIGQVTIPFTLTSALAGSTYSCNPNVANVGSNGTYSQTGDTLIGLGLQCTVAGSGSSYTVSITAGAGSASLERGPLSTRNEVLAAGFLTPFFLVIGFSGRTRRMRRTLFRAVFVALLTVAALSATGCSSGGFTRGGNQTYAVGGSYLIGINNAQGQTVTEVPLLVTGNGAGL